MKKTIAIVSAILIICTTVCFASDDTVNKSFIVNMTSDGATVYEADKTDINNAMLPVKVVKYINGIETIIFTENLGDYDNGAWSNTDFSKMQFLMILDWNTNEAIYIIPFSTGDLENENTIIRDSSLIGDKSISQISELTQAVSLNTQTINSEIEYDYTIKDIVINNSDGKRINVLKNNSYLTSVVAVKNSSDASVIKILAAVYNGTRLKNICTVNIPQTQATGEAILYNLNIPLSDIDENSSVKVMLWNDLGGMKPYALNISAYSGYDISLSTVVNQIYTIPITSNSNYRKFKIKYNSEYFEIDSLCKSADNKITTVGNATDNIRIDSIENNSFTFSFIGNKTDNCINYLSLKALKSGNCEIKVFEIEEEEE